MHRSFFGSTNTNLGSTKPRNDVNRIRDEYELFKNGSTVSKIPFSPPKRNRVESTYHKFDKPNGYGASVNKTTFSWKVPTYDL